MPQTSQVFSQRTWPGAGDLDDCWVLSAIQAANVTAPWLVLPTVTTFRAAAGDPDDGIADGGSLAEIVKGSEGVWPVLRGKLAVLDGVPYSAIIDIARKGHPVSVALQLGKLPPALRYTSSNVPHQSTLFWYPGPNGFLYFANPMAPAYSPWDRTTWAALQPAIEGIYGAGKCKAVAYPTEWAALALHPGESQLLAATWNAALDTAGKAVAAVPRR